MTFRQFAYNNVARNKRLYAAYFLSSMFTVMVFFTFSIFAYHPALNGDGINQNAAAGLSAAKWVIYVFSFFFVLYSMSSFLRSRQKEFGLLMMQGMSTGQLRQMVFLENMIIGFASTLGGIGLGLVFAKVILLIGERMLMLNEKLSFYIPIHSILVTFISFMILFVLISLFITAILRNRQLITLIKSNKTSKGEPKASIALSLIVVLLIGISYFISLRASGDQGIYLLVPIIIMVSIGTYLLFTQLSVYIIHRLKERKSFFWYKTNMLLLSDLAYRMKDNARTFFLVAIVSTVSFCAIGSLYGLQSLLITAKTDYNPYFADYVSTEKDNNKEQHIQYVNDILDKYHIVATSTQLNVLHYNLTDMNTKLAVVRLSDYNQLATLLGEPKITLSPKQAVMRKGSTLGVSTFDHLLNKDITLEKDISIHVSADWSISNVVPDFSSYMIIPDDLYQKLQHPSAMDQIFIWNGEPNQPQAIQAGKELQQWIKPHQTAYQFFAKDYEIYDQKQQFGLPLFMSLFIGIVFFVSAGSFLYFRLYSDLDEDKQKFKAISKLGLTSKELHRVLNWQIALLFFAPIVVALIHGAVALTTLSNMFQFSLVKESSMVLGVFLLIQIIYFFIVRHFYIRQVKAALR